VYVQHALVREHKELLWSRGEPQTVDAASHGGFVLSLLAGHVDELEAAVVAAEDLGAVNGDLALGDI
jgi:hypothetical protein